jgi:hypothetical protein
MNSYTLLRTIAGLSVSLFLVSCPETTIPTDFGEGPVKLDAKEWDGSWHELGSSGKDDVISFTVSSVAKGTIIAQGKGKDDKPLKLFLRGTGGKDEHLCYLTYTEKDEETEGPLRLATVAKDGVFYLWNVNNEEIRKALKTGELKGHLIKGEKEDDTHSQLTNDRANQSKLLDPKYWEWTKPEVFVRVPVD